MANDQLIEERIRARAHRLWEEEGRPEGRAEAHWEQARLIVALEDAQHMILKPVQAPEAEPIELVRNLGEFPTATDQGEEQTYPSSSSTAGEPLFESNLTDPGCPRATYCATVSRDRRLRGRRSRSGGLRRQ